MFIAIILLAFLIPALLLILRTRGGLCKKINPLIASYIIGLIIGNIGMVNETMIANLDLLATVAVALSIPLMLFSVNIRDWFRLSGRAGVSMILASVAVMLVSTLAYLLLGRNMDEGWKLPGLLTGLYTGGTPNLAAIKTALQVEQNLYLAVHTSDIVMSALYLLFLMTVAKPLLSKFLKPFTPKQGEETWIDETETGEKGTKTFLRRDILLPLSGAFGVAVLIFAVGAGLSFLVPEGISTMIVILVITSLSLGVSMIPRIRRIEKTFQLGEYFIFVFCIAVGAMGNLSKLFQAAPKVFLYVAVVISGTLLVHILLCKIFRIDVDTMLITSTSAICSLPFVGIVAVSIRNKTLLVPGITTGIIGYAVGNYLGILLSQAVKLLG
ncbi:MAG: DUF819 family protein [Spirochaetales bacterium]|nr:DUF819 family protein [Spirochaetales bacterium]